MHFLFDNIQSCYKREITSYQYEFMNNNPLVQPTNCDRGKLSSSKHADKCH